MGESGVSLPDDCASVALRLRDRMTSADPPGITRCSGFGPLRRSPCHLTARGPASRKSCKHISGARVKCRIPARSARGRPVTRMSAIDRAPTRGGAASLAGGGRWRRVAAACEGSAALRPGRASGRRPDRLRAPPACQSRPRMSCCRRVMYVFIAISASLGLRRRRHPRRPASSPRAIARWSANHQFCSR